MHELDALARPAQGHHVIAHHVAAAHRVQPDLARRARAAHFALLPLFEALFLETNPGPVKAALWLRGLIASEVRLPLAWPEEATVVAVREALDRTGVAAEMSQQREGSA